MPLAPIHPPAQTLHDLITIQARRDPNAPAILAPRREVLNFGGLLDQIDGIGAALNGWGFGRGDRIALLAGRGPETATAALGIASCAICAPLNATATLSELEMGLARVKAKALVVPGPAPGAIADLAKRLGIALLECVVQPDGPAGRFALHGGHAGTAALPGPAAADELAFVLSTSGTTARSKLVPISHANICARTDKTRRLFELTPSDRCLNLMPLCYHHGLNSGLMGPLAAGCSVILPPAFTIDIFLSCVRGLQPTFYTASFTYHQAILSALEQRPEAAAGHRLRFARSGSGPLAASVRIGIERTLGMPLLEVYGATETGTITANRTTGERRPGTVGTALDNDIAIMDADGDLVPAGVAGEVVVRGPTVFAGYEHDPAINQRLFVDDWYRTGDQGTMDADGYVKLLGRIDDIINRGGEKIAPREVDDALLDHPAVAEAVSFPIPHPTLHQEIAAAVVLRRDSSAGETELQQFLSGRLAPFKVPRRIVVTDALPKGPTGKLSRKELAAHFELAAAAAASKGAKAPPATAIQEILLKLWQDTLKRDDIGCDDNFFLCGGDSLLAVELLQAIEEKLQYRLSLTTLIEAATVVGIEQRLTSSTLGAAGDTIRIHSKGMQRPLFALGPRYGHTVRLIPVLNLLGPDQPSFALQPPGMDWSGAGCTTIPAMAAHYLGRIRSLQPQGPYRLIGTSFGGIIVYEIALQLQAAGETVDFLGLVDTNPATSMFAGYTHSVPSRVRPSGLYGPKPVSENSIEAVNNRVAAAHVNARRSYILDARSDENLFRGELTYFYCTGEPVSAGDHRRHWQQLAPGGFKLVPLPGRHGQIHSEPQLTPLSELLQSILAGGSVETHDPASAFGRSYRIEKQNGHEMIVAATGERYAIDGDSNRGLVHTVRTDAKGLMVRGWATEADRQKPARTVAVFLDGRCLGYGSSNSPSPTVARIRRTPTLQYAGFIFRFREEADHPAPQPRVFVLSPDGRAAELPHRGKPRAVG